MKKNGLGVVLFLLGAIYMILELIASRVLSPYFGTSNIIWTSIIGIILLSSSLGNYIGGIIADKENVKRNILIILAAVALSIMVIPFTQNIIAAITKVIPNLKIGAILSTTILFFIPSMLIGFLTPIIIKLNLINLEDAGKVSGALSSISTLGSITGTFIGGFLLIPNIGSTQLLFILSIITILLMLFIDYKKLQVWVCIIIVICINTVSFIICNKTNEQNLERVINGELNIRTEIDTQYTKLSLVNLKDINGNEIRAMQTGKATQSAEYLEDSKKYELYLPYTIKYNEMFNINPNIKDILIIGGAAYTYPKYYISHYLDKNIDVVEIDEKMTEIAKTYFYLQECIDEFDKNQERLKIYHKDGRIFLNENTKKYDAILNDAFSGETQAAGLATIEACKKIYDSLNEGGLYLNNIMGSEEGMNSRFLKTEVKTLSKVFDNIYVIPCREVQDSYNLNNNIVIATDRVLEEYEQYKAVIDENAIVLTDNYCPVENMQIQL